MNPLKSDEWREEADQNHQLTGFWTVNDEAVPVGFAVDSIRLIDYKGFHCTTVDFDSRIIVMIGGNGAGKTSLLESIVICLSWLSARIVNPRGAGLRIDQHAIRNGRDVAQVDIVVQYTKDKGNTAGARRWTVAGVRKGSGEAVGAYSDLGGLREVSSLFQNKSSDSKSSTLQLPLLAYYSVGRSVLDVPKRIRTRHDYNRLDTYEGALSDGKADFRKFFEWFREREDEELEQRQRRDSNYVDRGLEATRLAISEIMPGYGKPFIRRKGNEMILSKGATELSVSQLSDGERTLITMVADLARRLSLATEATELHEKPLSGYGTVLIDEIELHLHPEWQKQIVNRLATTFPNLQFIITTHSPLVLATIDKEHIRRLVVEEHSVNGHTLERRILLPEHQTAGTTSDDVLRDVMDVDPEANIEITERLDRYKALLQDRQYDTPEAIALHGELISHFGTTSRQMVELDSLRRIYERRKRLTTGAET